MFDDIVFDNIKITDLISSVSAFVASVTGVIVAYFAYQTYLKEPDQKDDAVDSNQIDDITTIQLKEFTIFQTSKQTTVLRVTNNTLECEIKDDRSRKGGIQWRLSADICKNILQKKLIRANPNYKPRTGLVTIGSKRDWLYSKNLFVDHAILEQDIYALLESIE